MTQSTDRNRRYARVDYQQLNQGDLVLLKEPLIKPTSYPMASVTCIERNDLGEAISLTVRKGNNQEVVTRHPHSVIPLLSLGPGESAREVSRVEGAAGTNGRKKQSRPVRAAALRSRENLAELISENSI